MNQTELKSFFYGTLIGDSYIHNGTFYCKQITKNLIEYKAKIIKKYLPDAKVWIKNYDAFTDKNGVHHQNYYVLNASSSEYIKKLYKKFYSNNNRVIPSDTNRYLSDIGLAMWYADDGTTILVSKNNNTGGSENRRIQFCCERFSLKDINFLRQILADKGYKNKLVKRKLGYRININPQDAQKMFCNIYDYFEKFFPEMLYKMDMGYRKDSLDKEQYVSVEYKQLYSRMSAHESFIDRMKDR